MFLKVVLRTKDERKRHYYDYLSCIQSAGLSEKIHKESESTDLRFSFHADNFY